LKLSFKSNNLKPTYTTDHVGEKYHMHQNHFIDV